MTASEYIPPTLVGEANPYGADPRFALYPDPRHSAGGRLCFDILGMSLKEYIGTFKRVNLCPSKWSAPVARARADALKTGHSRLILLGSKVCGAFGYPFEPWSALSGIRAVVLPHPSGLCRLWNEPRAIERARELVRGLIDEDGAA